MANVSGTVSKRVFYIDNIRIYLTILVILHHVAVAYGGSGGWPLKETPTDTISPIIFLLFNALNQSYFMSFFFILAGYFTPRSLEKKGAIAFMKGRLIRLGIPLIFFVALLAPVTYWVVSNIAYNLDTPFYDIWRDVLTFTSFRNISFGHLWFLEVLLLFAFSYVIYKNSISRAAGKVLFENSFPTNKIIVVFIFVLSAVTFLVRIWFPIDTWIFSVQPAHMARYLFSFIVGILACRGDWFSNLSKSQVSFWKRVAIINFLVLPIVIVLATGGDGSIDVFLGGFTWESLINSTWESISFTSIVISILHVFQRRFNEQGSTLRWMTPNVFGAYIFHQIVVVAVMIPLLGVVWPSVLKFVVVSVISVPLSFLVSYLIRKIPYITRII
jgi:hypothetical protein